MGLPGLHIGLEDSFQQEGNVRGYHDQIKGDDVAGLKQTDEKG